MRQVIAVLAILWAGMAQAAQVDIISITSFWSHTSVQDDWGGDANLTVENPNELRWGHSFSGNGPRSGFRFNATEDKRHQAGKDFTVGTFTHMNRVIFRGQHLNQATLNMTIVADFDGVEQTFVTSYIFTLWETDNLQMPNCANQASNWSGDNRNGCADRVQLLQNPSEARTFSNDETGLTYHFDLLGFESGSEFWTTEDVDNPIFLKARFSVIGGPEITPVPLPAGAWLLIGGVGALAAFGRRKARA